ncbi:MAG: ABC transporter ATP-binding protein [Planctomycetota bacterium]|jgi:putative ABC transport system ATP-binding protein
MIKIRDLLKSYRRGDESVVACDVGDLTVSRGEHVALVGQSGLGKSTLLNIIAGLLLPDQGSVRVQDVEITNLSEQDRDRFRAQHIGMVFQTFNLLQPFTALENVMLGAVFGKGHRHGLREQSEKLLARADLADRVHHRPNELSVGQAQRVAICRALINDPQLILADEPLGNQDKTTGREVLQLLAEMAREGDRTVVMVTHDPDSAAQMERVVELKDLRRELVA